MVVVFLLPSVLCNCASGLIVVCNCASGLIVVVRGGTSLHFDRRDFGGSVNAGAW